MSDNNIINMSGIVRESIVDGPGFRFTIFVQGCPHNCPECHNPGTHSATGGYKISVDNIISQIKETPLISGVTFSGGEPFAQPTPLAKLSKKIHKLGYDIICYTGYTYEKILFENDSEKIKLLSNVDVLIDGLFDISKRSIDLKFRGSFNQRVIDVKKSFKALKIVEIQF
ncbi:MAG: anaerobic ribonucleoside-triphosphate reductase activating protein [Oscillospiraceae bacterium]|jgi:anaerobic ribonucleoside-triphosphate reductase activating protein|nr:anaerobic ribonucleoside-triphosphate reductase activating protein [Oscillospiraceae bacterium]